MRSPRFRSQLLRQIAANKIALEFLADSQAEERQVAFENILLSLIPHTTTISEKKNIFRSFLSWCNDQTLDCPEEVKEAIRIRTGHKMKQRKTKRNFISRVGLNWGRVEREEYLSQIPTTTVGELSAPYPPLSHWVYESDEIKKKWEYWITKARQADARKKRLPMLELDPDKLVHDIDANTSMIFLNDEGKIVGLVIRNFCGDDDVLAWLDGVIEGAVGNRKSIRVCFHLCCTPCFNQLHCSLRIQESWSKSDIRLAREVLLPLIGSRICYPRSIHPKIKLQWMSAKVLRSHLFGI
jgi:hypothetical protein